MQPMIVLPKIHDAVAGAPLQRSRVVVVLVAWLAVASATDAGDAVPAAFEACTACHTYEQDEPAQEAPPLWGIVGRRTASVEGYDYSPALTAFGGTWSRARLDQFLTNPNVVVPGTYMKLGGVSNAAERAEVLDFLESISPARPTAAATRK